MNPKNHNAARRRQKKIDKGRRKSAKEPMTPAGPFRGYFIKRLKNPKEAVAYVRFAAEGDDYRRILSALRDIVQAEGGIGKLAKRTGLGRTSLYQTLSPRDNPKAYTLRTILAVYGIKIGFFPAAKR